MDMKYKAEWADSVFVGRDSGDTLVEVLIATTILATAVVAGLGIMNYGFGAVLNSIERTQVQAEITSQLSMARYARDEFVRARGSVSGGGAAQDWSDIMANADTAPSANVCTASGDPSPAANAFHLVQDATGGVRRVPGSPTATSTTPTAGDGLWLEAVKVTTPSDVNYIDIYAKACWQPSAGTINQESKSVTRLFVGQFIAATTPSRLSSPAVIARSALLPSVQLHANDTPPSDLEFEGVPVGSTIQASRTLGQYCRLALPFRVGVDQNPVTLEAHSLTNVTRGGDVAMTVTALRGHIA